MKSDAVIFDGGSARHFAAIELKQLSIEQGEDEYRLGDASGVRQRTAVRSTSKVR